LKVVIEINCDNEAFRGDDCGSALARILRPLADHFEFQSAADIRVRLFDPRILFDINGNRVGDATFIDD
jgi:hypothetical protein